MPTSAGKTKATELIIRSAFLAERTSLAVIVAPFRALCHEIRNSLVTAFRNEQVNVDELSDVMQGDFEIAELLNNKQVLVVTPEKFVYVLRHTPELAGNIGLLIFDEGHQFDSGSRGITYELLITSLNALMSHNVQKILISAVISNAPSLGQWLNGADSTVVSGTNLVPTFRTVAFASWLDQLGRLEFVTAADAEKEDFFVPRVIERLQLASKPKERTLRVFPNNKDGQDIALLLGLKLVKNGAVAIFCGLKTTAANLCERAVEIFERQVPLTKPSEYSDVGETERLYYLHAQNLGTEATATRSAQIGIFSHHGNTPHGIRLAVEHAMRENFIRFVVCTSTLAQGVNLPIRYLIVPSVYQGGDRIKVRDFHNLIGRAGRAGMHTEGSILFADPDVYDNRKNINNNWRWKQVKELLEPANSEPCISALLSFFDPLRSDDKKYRLSLEAMEFVDRYVNHPEQLANLAAEVAATHADKGFTQQGLQTQILWKLDVISSVESFLMSQWDTSGTPVTDEDVIALAKGTLAYFLADDADKQRILNLFTALAANISQKVSDPELRRLYGNTLFGVTNAQEMEQWTKSHIAELSSSEQFGDILNLVWPLLSLHIQNTTFRKCSKPEALKALALAWIEGKPFNALLGVLQQAEAKVIWGTKFREFGIEHVVDMCEGGLAYHGSLVTGAVIELALHAAPELANVLTGRLQLFQKMLKYGLPTASAIAVYEAGFSDRVVAADLSASLGLVADQRSDAVKMLRQESNTVLPLLQKYPSYFTHIMSTLL
jgi:superfamily II DNA/RNA helicase